MNNFELVNLSKSFDSKVEIFKNINFIFQSNSSYAITGVSGSGKSTLLNMIAGIIPPTSGKVIFNGHNLVTNTESQNNLFLQKTIGLVFQSDNLLSDLTVLENVMIKGLIQNIDFNEVKSESESYLEHVGLIDKKNFSIQTLSGGQRQKISIARALYGNPKFLLADEPTAHLDCKNKDLIIDLLLSSKSKFGMSLIITCHDILVAKAMDTILDIVDYNLIKINSL